MKCPLWMMGGIGSVNRYNEALGDCLKEGCTWWDANGGRCAVLELSRLGNALGNTLGTIARELTLLRPGVRKGL